MLARIHSASASCASTASFCHSSHIAFNSKISSQLRLSNVVFIFLFVRRWAFPHSLETLNHELRKKSTPKTTFFYFFLPTHLASLVPSTPFFQKKQHFIYTNAAGWPIFQYRPEFPPNQIKSKQKKSKPALFKTACIKNNKRKTKMPRILMQLIHPMHEK